MIEASLREADEAIRGGDSREFFGARLKVERTGLKKRRQQAYMGSGPPSRSEWRVIVVGLPRNASWQDLKDHMRAAGRVGYAMIEDDGVSQYLHLLPFLSEEW